MQNCQKTTAAVHKGNTKHAYLIIAHNNLRILKMLVSALDDPRNDIYIHIDRKVKGVRQWKRELVAKQATLIFTRRIRVNWGGSSQIQAEWILLEEATKTEHAYYHLLSGVDMPLRDQDHIHGFLEENQGKEFISISQTSREGTLIADRIGQYHFLQNRIGSNHGIHIAVAERIENILLRLQKRLGIDRLRDCGILYKGENWFSITHKMAVYVLRQKRMVKKRFRCSLCADELFLQNVAMNSPYAQNITGSSMRCVDWNRGTPYTFRQEDFDMLCASGKLFARKFDENVDMQIVERIYRHICSGKDCLV